MNANATLQKLEARVRALEEENRRLRSLIAEYNSKLALMEARAKAATGRR